MITVHGNLRIKLNFKVCSAYQFLDTCINKNNLYRTVIKIIVKSKSKNFIYTLKKKNLFFLQIFFNSS